MTRTQNQRKAQDPNAIMRMPDGVCVECAQPVIPPCVSCGQPLRVSSVPARLAPGTKVRRAEGMCRNCFVAKLEELAAAAPGQEVVEEVTPEKLAHTIRGLEAYMARRRERLAS